MKIKPYLLFAGDNYYPSAAFGDIKGSFWTCAEAEARGKELVEKKQRGKYLQAEADWYEVVFVEMEEK